MQLVMLFPVAGTKSVTSYMTLGGDNCAIFDFSQLLLLFYAKIPPRTAKTIDAPTTRFTILHWADGAFRGPATSSIPSKVFPLTYDGWTLSCVHTSDDTTGTYLTTSMPGAVTKFVQIFATTVFVDCRPLVLLSFDDHISASHPISHIIWPCLSCFSVGEQCDMCALGFA